MATQDDSRLLGFDTYQDYLDSFISKQDLCFLRSTYYGRCIAELGYRSTSETLSKRQFQMRKEAVRELLYPSRKPHVLITANLDLSEPLLRELQDRERANRTNILSTIIYLRHHTKKGYEISGYIDFQDSLTHAVHKHEGATDWYEIFQNNKRLWPYPTDLGYYHWRTGKSIINNTNNYKVITDPVKGLLFINRHDRKHISVDPSLENPGSNTTRTIVYSDRYDHVVLYDHVSRMNI